MQASNAAKLSEVFQAVLNLPPGTDVTAATPTTVAGWDSLAHALLITAMESEFGVQIDPAESLDLTSYQAAAAFLAARGL